MLYDLIVDVKLQGVSRRLPLGRKALEIGSGSSCDLILLDQKDQRLWGSVEKCDRLYYWVSFGDRTSVSLHDHWVDLGLYRIRVQKNHMAFVIVGIFLLFSVILGISSLFSAYSVSRENPKEPHRVYRLPFKEKMGWLDENSQFVSSVYYAFEASDLSVPYQIHFSAGNVEKESVHIFVNRKFIGYVPRHCRSCWTRSQSIDLPSDFLVKGKNLVEFYAEKQQKWGLKEVFVGQGNEIKFSSDDEREKYLLAQKLFLERNLKLGNLQKAMGLLSGQTHQEAQDLRIQIENIFQAQSKMKHMQLEKMLQEGKFDHANNWFEMMELEYPQKYLQKSIDLMKGK